MYRQNMNQPRPRKSFSAKKIVVAGLIATALAFNVFLNDPSGSPNLRTSKRNLAVVMDDGSSGTTTFSRLRAFSSTSYRSANNIVRRTQRMQDGGEQVIVHYLPSYDILQTDAGVKLSVEVPGFSLDQLVAEIRKNEILHLSGTRFNDETNETEEFDISFQLDAKFVNMKAISMSLENDVLTATAPLKTEKDKEQEVVKLDIFEGPPQIDLLGDFLGETGLVGSDTEEGAEDSNSSEEEEAIKTEEAEKEDEYEVEKKDEYEEEKKDEYEEEKKDEYEVEKKDEYEAEKKDEYQNEDENEGEENEENKWEEE